jgi:hypothetical protein
MAESVAEDPATMQVTTQDEDAGESEREESAKEEPVAVEKVVESSTIRKGKWKVAPARAKVYATMDEPVSDLPKLSSIRTNLFAHSAIAASRGR